MIIAIGADHGGFELKEKVKEYLNKKGHKVKDYGTHSTESCDYPKIGFEVAKAVSDKKVSRGILVCKTGIGEAIVANKVPGARAAVCPNITCARFSRQHNDVNVLVFGSLFVKEAEAKKILDVWLETKFEGGRHKRRVNQIREIERKIAGTGLPACR
ncbi:MAG: ribose 5-phosphate isomerase B [Candidatus Omnitrophota bacterium]